MTRVVEKRLGEQRRIAEPQLCLRGALAVGVVDLIGAVAPFACRDRRRRQAP